MRRDLAERFTPRPRPGFTVLELLVSVAIIGLLFALILPAVAQVRRASQRLDCSNRLRQLALAASNYQTDWRVYPKGGQDNDRYIFHVLLPYMENTAVADRVEQEGVGGFRSASLPEFVCPADPETGPVKGYLNYFWNDGVGQSARLAGMLTHLKFPDHDRGRHLTPASVSDGLSDTAMMSERLLLYPESTIPPVRETQPSDGESRPLRFVWYLDRRYSRGGEMAEFRNACRTKRVGVTPHGITGPKVPWWDALSQYDHSMAPNSPGCYAGPPPTTHGEFSDLQFGRLLPASSLHDGGVNVAGCDGAVRFVSEFVNGDTWAAFGTRAAGDLVADF